MTRIDLPSHNALCGLMAESGRRLVHKQLPCGPPAILQLLPPCQDRLAAVAIESTCSWYWLADGLRDHGYRVVLANPARLKPSGGLKHTGAVSDAFCLTKRLRLKILPAGHLCGRKTPPRRASLSPDG